MDSLDSNNTNIETMNLDIEAMSSSTTYTKFNGTDNIAEYDTDNFKKIDIGPETLGMILPLIGNQYTAPIIIEICTILGLNIIDEKIPSVEQIKRIVEYIQKGLRVSIYLNQLFY